MDDTAAMKSILQPGAKVLGERFRVQRLLGGGGMGEVYLAEQVSLGRRVALKVLKQNLSTGGDALERFKREAQLLSSVEHPSVVRVIDFGLEGGTAYLVMELAEGSTLEQLLRDGPLTPARAVPLLAQLASGLAAIHARGIIHRDLKTENVIVSASDRGEQARLLDFGIARLIEDDAAVTRQGLVLGTPQYISPEQATGAGVDARSDLYALGVLAFRLLGGRYPFKGPSARDFLTQHVAAAPLLLGEVAPGLAGERALCALVQRCLEKDPAARPASAAAVAQELMSWTPGAVGAGAPVGTGTAAFGVAPTPRTVSSGSLRLPLITGSNAVVPRTQNVALMLTDIQGFTELTARQTREENARLLEEHDRVLLPVIRGYGGKLLQKRGDALLVSFPSPTEAVCCGMAVQDALWRHNHDRAEALTVRVVLHAGEVAISRDGVVGEPLQIVEALEAQADGGEVVFTESIRLSMNRAEVEHEACGAMDVPGRDEKLNLYRSVRRAEGPPFGGRDVSGARAGATDLAALSANAQLSLTRARAFLTSPAGGQGVLRLPRVLRQAMAATLAAAVLGGAGWGLLRPEARIARLVEAGEFTEALRRVESQPGAKRSPPLQTLRARALHGLGRHSEELGALDAAGWSEADARALQGVLEDAGRNGLNQRYRDVLRKASPARLAEVFDPERLAPEDIAAVRALDQLHDGRGLNRVEAYSALLAAEDCGLKAMAANRLGELGDAEAKEALEKLASTPKEVVLVIEKNCGQDEARNALRRLGRDQ